MMTILYKETKNKFETKQKIKFRAYKMKQIAQVQEFQESFNQVVNREPSLVNKELAGLC
jgi:hypothetical protein